MSFLNEIEKMSVAVGWRPEELKTLAEIYQSITDGRSKIAHVKKYFEENPEKFLEIFERKSVPMVIRILRKTKRGENTPLLSYIGKSS